METRATERPRTRSKTINRRPIEWEDLIRAAKKAGIDRPERLGARRLRLILGF